MTIRTRAALLALAPNNTSGLIEEVDIRDFMDSAAPALATANISGPATYSLNSGDVAELTLTGNVTSFSITGGVAGQKLTIAFVQDATGSRTLAGVTGILWEAATAPTLSTAPNRRDVFNFYFNGTSWVECGGAARNVG